MQQFTGYHHHLEDCMNADHLHHSLLFHFFTKSVTSDGDVMLQHSHAISHKLHISRTLTIPQAHNIHYPQTNILRQTPSPSTDTSHIYMANIQLTVSRRPQQLVKVTPIHQTLIHPTSLLQTSNQTRTWYNIFFH